MFVGVIHHILFVSSEIFIKMISNLESLMFTQQVVDKTKVSATRVPLKCSYKAKEIALFESIDISYQTASS